MGEVNNFSTPKEFREAITAIDAEDAAREELIEATLSSDERGYIQLAKECGLRNTPLAVVYDEWHNFLLVKPSRAPKTWGFVQGGVEEGEDPKTAVVRELFSGTENNPY